MISLGSGECKVLLRNDDSPFAIGNLHVFLKISLRPISHFLQLFLLKVSEVAYAFGEVADVLLQVELGFWVWLVIWRDGALDDGFFQLLVEFGYASSHLFQRNSPLFEHLHQLLPLNARGKTIQQVWDSDSDDWSQHEFGVHAGLPG